MNLESTEIDVLKHCLSTMNELIKNVESENQIISQENEQLRKQITHLQSEHEHIIEKLNQMSDNVNQLTLKCKQCHKMLTNLKTRRQNLSKNVLTLQKSERQLICARQELEDIESKKTYEHDKVTAKKNELKLSKENLEALNINSRTQISKIVRKMSANNAFILEDSQSIIKETKVLLQALKNLRDVANSNV